MQNAAIILSETGFKIVVGRQTIEKVLFDDVVAIVAYKVDEIITDLICCDIQTGSGGSALIRTVHEEMPGFESLMERFNRLPGFYQNWREAVVLPPFAENRTVLFERAKSAD